MIYDMKTLILTIISVLFISQSVFAQKAVRDPYKRRQLEAMVFMKWNKGHFRPKWYYWLFHNKYRRGEDRRTIKQLLPIYAYANLEKYESEDAEEQSNEMMKQELTQDLNKRANLSYHLYYKNVFAEIKDDCNQYIIKAYDLGLDADVVDQLIFERERIDGHVEIILEGYLDNGDTNEGLKNIETEYREYRAFLKKFVKLYETRKKYD